MKTSLVTGITGQALLVKDIPAASLTTFITDLKRETEAEVKKKEVMRSANLEPLVRRLLWEFPSEQRFINFYSIPVLQQRLHTLPLPDRRALASHLAVTPHKN